MSELIKHIKEYFGTYNNREYTIYVDGTATEKCEINDNTNYVVWRSFENNEFDWDFIEPQDIEAIKLSATTMEIIKTNGKVYNFIAKLKTKEKKAKEVIFKAKMALHANQYGEVLHCLIKLDKLMDEQ